MQISLDVWYKANKAPINHTGRTEELKRKPTVVALAERNILLGTRLDSLRHTFSLHTTLQERQDERTGKESYVSCDGEESNLCF